MRALIQGVTVLAAGGALLAATAVASSSPTPATQPAADTYAVDATHSSVVFKTMHVGVSEFFGRFNQVDGEVVYDAADPSRSKVRIEIPVASIDTNNQGRDEHLRNADFFSAKEYPKLVFESTSVEADGDELAVQGDLTVRGTTKPVTATVRKIGEGDAMGAYRAGFTAQFEMDMREFGFQFVEQKPGAVGPTVDVWVALELTKQG